MATLAERGQAAQEHIADTVENTHRVQQALEAPVAIFPISLQDFRHFHAHLDTQALTYAHQHQSTDENSNPYDPIILILNQIPDTNEGSPMIERIKKFLKTATPAEKLTLLGIHTIPHLEEFEPITSTCRALTLNQIKEERIIWWKVGVKLAAASAAGYLLARMAGSARDNPRAILTMSDGKNLSSWIWEQGVPTARMYAGEASIYSPNFSPKGDQLAFVKLAWPRNYLVISDNLGAFPEEKKRFYENGVNGYVFDLQWLNDKTLILGIGDPPNFQHFSLYTIDTATGDLKWLTSGLSASPSPDGKTVAYLQDETLMTIDVETKKRTEIAENVLHVSWSPDNSHLVFTHQGKDYHPIIYQYDRNTQSYQQMTEKAILPFYSFDGSKLFYLQEENGGYHLMQMDTDGNNKKQISGVTMSSFYFPIWVDETTLLVVARIPGPSSIEEELMLIDVNTQAATNLCPSQYYGKVCNDKEKPFSITVRNGRMETKD